MTLASLREGFFLETPNMNWLMGRTTPELQARSRVLPGVGLFSMSKVGRAAVRRRRENKASPPVVVTPLVRRGPTLSPEEVALVTWTVWDGDYDKQHYWLLLSTAEVVHCWPNAGFMVACDGSHREWVPDGKLKVSPAGLRVPIRPKLP
jgi:hypothetical protein